MKSNKRKATKTTTKAAPKKGTAKTLNFQEGSFRAKTLKLLSDGKPRTAEQIVSGIGGKKNMKKRTPVQFVRPIIDRLKTAGIKVTSPEVGKYQIPRRASA